MKQLEQDIKLFQLVNHVEQLQRLVDAMPKSDQLVGDDTLVLCDLNTELNKSKVEVFNWYREKHCEL